jgi:hypothetical protein
MNAGERADLAALARDSPRGAPTRRGEIGMAKRKRSKPALPPLPRLEVTPRKRESLSDARKRLRVSYLKADQALRARARTQQRAPTRLDQTQTPASDPSPSFALAATAIRDKARQDTGPRYRLRILKITGIKLVGPEFVPTMKELRRPGRGAPRKDVIAFGADVADHPNDSIRGRATRLKMSRSTVRRLLERLKKPHDVQFEKLGGPIAYWK